MRCGPIVTLIFVQLPFLLAEDCPKAFLDPSQPTAFVCACSKERCAKPFDAAKLSDDFSREGAVLYRTSDGGDRLARSKLDIHAMGENSTTATTNRLVIDRTWKFQKIIGFGGGMTDAAALNIDRLMDASMRQRLLEGFFANDGLGYNILRIPMASCDFSTREYSYAEKNGDFDLASFVLVEEDEWKLRHTKESMAISKAAGRELKVFASPWSAPAWMKTNGHMAGGGSLKEGEHFWATWANYFVKFIESYTASGVPIWSVTTQNEPSVGAFPNHASQAMSLSPEQAQHFVRDLLHPALTSSKVARDTKIIIHDDFRQYLPDLTDKILSDPAVASVVAGIGVHWYFDTAVDYFITSAPPENLDRTHEGHPSQFILATEACFVSTHSVSYGNFTRAMIYAKDIVEYAHIISLCTRPFCFPDLNHWVNGWVDWNIALDPKGGPNWVSNFADSTVIVDAEKQTFYKQPMFYALGQFSRFLEPDAIRIAAVLEEKINGVDTVAFQNPNGTIAVVLLNYNAESTVSITLVDGNSSIPVTLEPMSINTVIYRLAAKQEKEETTTPPRNDVSISLATTIFTLLSLLISFV